MELETTSRSGNDLKNSYLRSGQSQETRGVVINSQDEAVASTNTAQLQGDDDRAPTANPPVASEEPLSSANNTTTRLQTKSRIQYFSDMIDAVLLPLILGYFVVVSIVVAQTANEQSQMANQIALFSFCADNLGSDNMSIPACEVLMSTAARNVIPSIAQRLFEQVGGESPFKDDDELYNKQGTVQTVGAGSIVTYTVLHRPV
ncbi:hypothetical protein B0H66DRAFT_641904 [Apodospora peruviana]|uniref:Uncharacterized protein n=1 Tax=Apodospora peruviana TaxID=516989 RepID=A0AAE0M0M5_9PEZI|nr:hypothetical protein B0H66DRAFT_641904 [Apodospora peruviana]